MSAVSFNNARSICTSPEDIVGPSPPLTPALLPPGGAAVVSSKSSATPTGPDELDLSLKYASNRSSSCLSLRVPASSTEVGAARNVPADVREANTLGTGCTGSMGTGVVEARGLCGPPCGGCCGGGERLSGDTRDMSAVICCSMRSPKRWT